MSPSVQVNTRYIGSTKATSSQKNVSQCPLQFTHTQWPRCVSIRPVIFVWDQTWSFGPETEIRFWWDFYNKYVRMFRFYVWTAEFFFSDAERHVQRNGRLFTDEGPGTTTEPHQQGSRHVCMWSHSLREFIFVHPTSQSDSDVINLQMTRTMLYAHYKLWEGRKLCQAEHMC